MGHPVETFNYYAFLDWDKDGDISAREYQTGSRVAIDLNLTLQEAEYVLGRADEDKDGKVTYEEIGMFTFFVHKQDYGDHFEDSEHESDGEDHSEEKEIGGQKDTGHAHS